MNAEIFAALAQLEKERGIPQSYMIEKITQALVAAYKKDKDGYTDNVFVEVKDDDMHMYVQKEVVDDVITPATEITLDAARKISKTAQLGDLVNVDVQTKAFGRIAAQTAKQVIIQGIREAERGMVFDTFSSKEHEILTGIVTRIDPRSGAASLRIGSGSESDPWQIATADRWNEIAQSINGTQPGDYKAGDYYLVTNDIDFSGKNFIAWDSFSGQLTGNGNSLKGITATRTVAEADIDADAAIFGVIRINSGTVKDLKIEATLTSNGNRIGGMTGRNNGTLDGVYFVKGTLTGVKRVGGIAGENNSVIVNCAVLGGNISSSGENAGGITGGNTNAKAFVINCYSWMESLVSSGPNTGGIIGYGGSDSFAVNCYTTTATVVSGGMYGGAVGYVKKSNLQNIYGNSAVGVAVGRAKNTGSNVPSVWPTQTSRALSLGEMMSGSVSVPSNNTEYGSFVEALNAGVDIFNSATFSQKPEGVVLRRWKSSGTYPVLAD